jgi:hypothetical protein
MYWPARNESLPRPLKTVGCKPDEIENKNFSLYLRLGTEEAFSECTLGSRCRQTSPVQIRMVQADLTCRIKILPGNKEVSNPGTYPKLRNSYQMHNIGR